MRIGNSFCFDFCNKNNFMFAFMFANLTTYVNQHCRALEMLKKTLICLVFSLLYFDKMRTEFQEKCLEINEIGVQKVGWKYTNRGVRYSTENLVKSIQCLHDLHFMKKRSISPNLSSLAPADITWRTLFS